MRVTLTNPSFTPTVNSLIKPTIHILHILDRSGSMGGSKLSAAKEGMISELKMLEKDTEVFYTYTVLTFSNHGENKTVLNQVPVSLGIKKLCDTINSIKADSMTALYDAIGLTLPTFMEYHKESTKVLVKIFTDGMDNDSKYYTSAQVGSMIEQANAKGMVVAFVGTDQDVASMQRTIKLKVGNTLAYDGTGAGLQRSYQVANSATMMYSKAVVKGTADELTTSFFSSTN